MFLKNIFCERVKELRISHNLTQKKLGSMINMPGNTISMIENKERAASIEVIYSLADYFNVSIDYLVGRTDNPNSHKN